MSKIVENNLMDQFMGWQCRIRQYAVRKDEGRPSPGMRPVLSAKQQTVGPINVQLVKEDSGDTTAQFRFMHKKTVDPRDRRSAAIKLLSERYYQIPGDFSEEMTAIFATESELADQLVQIQNCELVFEQGNQRYALMCSARLVDPDENAYQSSYWQNALFNPTMPGLVKVIGFMPQWDASQFMEI